MLLASACGNPPDEVDGGVDGGRDWSELPDEPQCTEATPVTCRDESTQQLQLKTVINYALVEEEGTTAGEFTTHFDSRAGGLTPNTSYLYVRFTAGGVQPLDLSDEDAFTSMEWDLAVRRFVLRINSGVAGPSCTQVARLPAGATFENTEQVPGELTWRTEEYFTGETCEYVPSTSGIGDPATALSSFWSYSSCLQMTGNVYVLHLRDGRYVKLTVLTYYDYDDQEYCQETGVAGSTAGNVRIRWAFIQGPD